MTAGGLGSARVLRRALLSLSGSGSYGIFFVKGFFLYFFFVYRHYRGALGVGFVFCELPQGSIWKCFLGLDKLCDAHS